MCRDNIENKKIRTYTHSVTHLKNDSTVNSNVNAVKVNTKGTAIQILANRRRESVEI